MVTSGVREKPGIYRLTSSVARVTRPLAGLTRPARVTRATVSAHRPSRLVSRYGLNVAATTLMGLIALGMALAPLVAIAAATWATVTALNALWRLAGLIQSGQALDSPQTPILLNSLETAGRAGFLAAGYLALIFGLITLMAGLFGRRWGRLYVVPGATLTLTALGMVVTGLLIARPLEAALSINPAWLALVVAYALTDAVLVSGALVDTRLTRSPSATGKLPALRRASPPAAA